MMITYPRGNVRNAIVLSQEAHEVRATAAGCEDVLVFTRVHGAWLSEDLEPATLQFEWQWGGTTPACSEDDCICPKELVSHLMSTPLGACEPAEPEASTLHVFSPEG